MKSKPILFMILTAVCCMTSGTVRAAEDILFRTAVTPEEPWVGQQVLLSVDVLAKDGWAQLKKISDFEIDGAHVLRLETQGVRLNEVIDGDSYTGQRYEFMLFPQRDGRFTILPTPVDVEVRSWGVGRGDQIHRLSLPVIEFAARTPPGAEGIRGLISTTDLTASQSWDPEIDRAEVGDAIERTIILRASDVSGMAFAPMLHGKTENLGIYPGEPTVEDTFDRGDLNGAREETVTYVFEQPGEFEIPGMSFSWWDVRNAELKRIDVPGLSMRVLAGPATDSAVVNEVTQLSYSWPRWAALIAAVITALIAFRFGRQALDRFASWCKARNETEAVYFKRVLRSGDRKVLLRETMRWLDRINSNSQPARLDRFLEQYGDTDTQLATADLMTTLTVDQDKSTVSRFVHGLATARKRWRRAQRTRQRAAILLPELNGGT